jgi:hypothetical protein
MTNITGGMPNSINRSRPLRFNRPISSANQNHDRQIQVSRVSSTSSNFIEFLERPKEQFHRAIANIPDNIRVKASWDNQEEAKTKPDTALVAIDDQDRRSKKLLVFQFFFVRGRMKTSHSWLEDANEERRKYVYL